MFNAREIADKYAEKIKGSVTLPHFPVYLTFARLRDNESEVEILATTAFEFTSSPDTVAALEAFLSYIEKLAELHGYGETFALYARQDTPDDLPLDDSRADSNTLAIDGDEPLAVVQTDGKWEGAQ